MCIFAWLYLIQSNKQHMGSRKKERETVCRKATRTLMKSGKYVEAWRNMEERPVTFMERGYLVTMGLNKAIEHMSRNYSKSWLMRELIVLARIRGGLSLDRQWRTSCTEGICT